MLLAVSRPEPSARRKGGDQPGDQQTAKRGEQQRPSGRRGVQALPPRHPLRRLSVRRSAALVSAFGRLQHPLHSDRRVRRCDKCCRCDVRGGAWAGAAPSRRPIKSSLAAVIDLKLLREDPDAVRALPTQPWRRPCTGRCAARRPMPPAGPRFRPPTSCAPNRRPPASRWARHRPRSDPRCWNKPRHSPSRSRPPKRRRPRPKRRSPQPTWRSPT